MAKKEVKKRRLFVQVTLLNSSGGITNLKQWVVKEDSKQHLDIKKKYYIEGSIPAFNRASYKYNPNDRSHVQYLEILLRE